MKYICYSIIILTIQTVFGENLNDEQAPAGELRLAFEEQSPETILKKCASVSHEPTLTPTGVINPFLECLNGNSEMSNYISAKDQQKPLELNPSFAQEESQPLESGSFDANAADPTESSDDLHDDEIKEFLQMVESNNQALITS